MSSSTWTQTHLSQLLPLDEDSVQQILDYTSTLSNEAAAVHLKNLLGDSPKALEFISSYNARRTSDATSSTAPVDSVPRHSRKSQKKKAPLNNLPPPRQPEDYGNVVGAYRKQDEEDYVASRKKSRPAPALSTNLALSNQPDARQLPKASPGLPSVPAKPPPSAAGALISDLPNIRSGSRTSSRTSSPAPKTTISVPGGASMHGASTTLQDLVRRLHFPT